MLTKQQKKYLKIFAPTLAAVILLAAIIWGAKYFPKMLQVSSPGITGTITFLDEYQRYIEVKTTGNDSKVFRVTITGIPIEKEDADGSRSKGTLSSLGLGASVELTASPSEMNKENDTITPSLVTVLP